MNNTLIITLNNLGNDSTKEDYQNALTVLETYKQRNLFRDLKTYEKLKTQLTQSMNKLIR